MARLLRICGPLLLAVALLFGAVVLVPGGALAAELLQVRSASLLQVGDSNRSYGVELACVVVNADQQQPAIAWLRQQLPRRSRVNLRPIGNHDGILLAKVQKLGASQDLGSGLVAAGLASPIPDANGCLT